MSNPSIDTLITEVTRELEAGTTDVKDSMTKYTTIKEKLENIKLKIDSIKEELSESITEEHTDELISDTEFRKYLNELEEIKKNITDNDYDKIDIMIEVYKNSIEKINKCRDYLESLKLEVVNI